MCRFAWLAIALVVAGCSDITGSRPSGPPDELEIEFAQEAGQIVATASARGQIMLRAAILPQGMIIDMQGRRQRMTYGHAEGILARHPHVAVPQYKGKITVVERRSADGNEEGDGGDDWCWDCYPEFSDAEWFGDDGDECCTRLRFAVGIATAAAVWAARAAHLACVPGLPPQGCVSALGAYTLAYASSLLAVWAMHECEKDNGCFNYWWDEAVVLLNNKQEYGLCSLRQQS